MTEFGERNHLPFALVTGACGVMGVAIARRLAQRHFVYLADINAEAAVSTAEAMRREGFSVMPICCDVTDRAAVAAAVTQIAANGELRVLAHVVALSPSMASWDKIMSVNLVGAAFVLDAVARVMSRNSAAVLISSVGGHMIKLSEAELEAIDDPLSPSFLGDFERARNGAPDTTSAYMISKLGLMRLSRHLAPDWGLRGARVVTLSPGLIATEMGDLEFKHHPEKHDFMRRMPIARLGSVSEVADAVEFLASDRASYITGTDLLIDGGMSTLI